MIQLTAEQQQELGTAELVRVFDPQTQRVYILVPADVYERLQELLDNPEAMYPLLADLQPEDWEDASNYGMSLKKS